MNWFKNLKTRSKLLLGFGVMCALLIGLSAIAYKTLASIQKNEREEVDPSNVAATEALQIRSHQNRIRSEMLLLLMTEDPSGKAAIKREIDDRSEDINQGLGRLKVFLTAHELTEDIALVAELEKELTAYREGRTEQFKLIEADKPDEAQAMGSGVQEERFERIRETLLKIGDDLKKHADAAVAESARLFSGAIRVFVVIAVVSALFAIFMVWLMNRMIAVPLQAVTGVAERVAEGDLTAEVKSDGRLDEVGALEQSFVKMIESSKEMSIVAEKISAGDLSVVVKARSEKDILGNALSEMLRNLREQIHELKEGVSVLMSSSSQIVTTIAQLATSISETASSASETTTTVEEVRQTATVSSQKARSVSETAQKAAQISVAGKKATGSTVEGMSRIKEQVALVAESIVALSEQGQAIGEIIAAVDDLSEQTNLLAVNASIEAVKAGEHGKGFSVVAQEVKSLAGESKQATKRVRAILNDIQKATSKAVMVTEEAGKTVDGGVKQAGQSGEAIITLAESISEAAQAATQIAASSQQQLAGMDQVASAMENIKEASAQNASGAKQLEVAAKNLSELGSNLNKLVAWYKFEA